MTPYLSVQTAKPGLDAFLSAPIGEEGNGMTLSVLSGLNRLAIDPRREAARLSELPKELAIAALGEHIARLPRGMWQSSDTMGIAARLVDLLPMHDPHARVNPPAPCADSRKPIASFALWLIAAGVAMSLAWWAIG
jgi:hypothetical protein